MRAEHKEERTGHWTNLLGHLAGQGAREGLRRVDGLHECQDGIGHIVGLELLNGLNLVVQLAVQSNH
jgi:hypothetical protein